MFKYLKNEKNSFANTFCVAGAKVLDE